MNDVPNVKSNILCCILPELSIVLFCIYHPYWGNSSAHNSVLDSLQDYFDRLLLSHGSNLQMVLCGDVNGLTKHLSPFLLTNGLSQLITFCTREENIIDIFATTKPSFYCQPVRLSPLGRSDHAGFFIQSIDHSFQSSSVQKIMTRDFRQKNHDSFLSLLHRVEWASLLNVDSIDLSISIFNDLVCHFFDECFPIRSVRLRSNDPPWMTPFIKLLFD